MVRYFRENILVNVVFTHVSEELLRLCRLWDRYDQAKDMLEKVVLRDALKDLAYGFRDKFWYRLLCEEDDQGYRH